MEMDKLTRELTGWIKAQVNGAGAKGAVFGMSGGIDSSVIAALCIRAFPKNSLGLIMPCYSSEEDQEHAEIVARQFSIRTRLVVLDSFADVFINNMPGFNAAPSVNRLAQANLKARLRMVTLYYAANQLNYLVVGSGNRAEMTAGYFTKYGDSGVDILPIGNLVKKEVRELALYLEIPQVIIDKPPTAGLWPGQTDEGEMGFTYEVLDSYILTGQAQAGIKKSIDTMNARSAHKRAMPPVPDF
jgi:NAD+ synthase